MVLNTKAFYVLISVFLACSLFAEDIELPEVTTVISGETEKVGEEALPDFSDVLKLPVGSGDLEPVLPEVENGESRDIASGKAKPVEKSVYAEGLIGGGYPSFFTGNISVARTVGASPFNFSFEHESAAGYAKKSVTDGYSDRNTRLSVEKKYKKNQFEWGAFGSYKSVSDGLQGNVISNGNVTGLLNSDLYSAGGDISYLFDNGFSIAAAADTDFYNRYAETPCVQIISVGFFSVMPSLAFRWSGHGFDTGCTGD